MKILVTGANGFTGRHFSKIAKDAGHNVVPLQSNLTDAKELSLEVKSVSPELVLHLAAVSFVGHKMFDDFYKTNVIGTTNLLDALCDIEVKPMSIVLASSATVYGNSKASPISETEIPSPTNHYAMSKLAMEYMAKNYFDKLPIIIARPFNYTGPGQSEDFIIPKLISHFVNNKKKIDLGNIYAKREFNDVSFICKVYLELLKSGNPGDLYNICSGVVHSVEEILDYLIKTTNQQILININKSLVRKNDINILSGNPEKLNSFLLKNNFPLTKPDLSSQISKFLNYKKD